MNQEQARERIKELKDFYSHLAAYVVVNTFLCALNLFISPEYLWFVWSLLGWGIGIAIHAFEVFWTSASWEQRKMEELTGLKETQDEVKRLTERTDALVTILAGVNWENIDPELINTRENLEAAQAKVAALRENHDEQSKQQVSREIERLEEFVTSSKFAYYDMAAKEAK